MSTCMVFLHYEHEDEVLVFLLQEIVSKKKNMELQDKIFEFVENKKTIFTPQ